MEQVLKNVYAVLMTRARITPDLVRKRLGPATDLAEGTVDTFRTDTYTGSVEIDEEPVPDLTVRFFVAPGKYVSIVPVIDNGRATYTVPSYKVTAKVVEAGGEGGSSRGNEWSVIAVTE